jgi:predicted HTH transcriptional regulator
VSAQLVPDATLDDLDLSRVRMHIETALTKGRYRGTDDPLRFLLQHKAIVQTDDRTLIPTITGIMLFAYEPQTFLPHAVIDLAQFYGTKPLSYEVVDFQKSIGGCLPEQIDHIERYLWKNTMHGFRLGDGAQRVEEHEYLSSVLRELTVNAVAHRDYTFEQSVIRVSLFRDRVEWTSPGALPEGVTLDNILDAQLSRNPAILTLLYQGGYVEGFGMGLNTVFEALDEEGLPSPRLVNTPMSFTVTVYGRPRGDFEPDDGSHAAPATHELTPAQQRIYTLILQRGELSFAEIEAESGGRSRRSLQRDVKSLIDARLITTVGATWQLRYIPRH